jgi:hypothetical protein
MALVQGQTPPGPVGFGPGFWRYDPLAGGWRDDMDSRGWFSGENAGDQEGVAEKFALGASSRAGYSQLSPASRAASPLNPQIAAAWAALHPTGNTAKINGLNNPSYNPDVWMRALQAGFKPPPPTAQGVPPPASSGAQAAPAPFSAAGAGFTQGETDDERLKRLLGHAMGVT